MRTSDICAAHDGDIIEVSKAVPGVNIPPLHPWCRRATIAVFDDDIKPKLKRRAKDPETGEDMLVPADVTYSEWKNSLTVDNDSGIMKTSVVGKLAEPYKEELIPHRVKEYMANLKNYGDEIEVTMPLSFEEMALMSRQTGVEYASITIENKNYVIRGNERQTPISKEFFEHIKEKQGIVNCHSHPYIGDLRASAEDLRLARLMSWQEEFYIVTPDLQYAVYTSRGIVDIRNIKKNVSDEDLKFYEEIFGG